MKSIIITLSVHPKAITYIHKWQAEFNIHMTLELKKQLGAELTNFIIQGFHVDFYITCDNLKSISINDVELACQKFFL